MVITKNSKHQNKILSIIIIMKRDEILSCMVVHK